MKKDLHHRKPENFIKQPKYPGGQKAMDAFIRQHLRYPEAALENKVEGIVAVEFDIDVFGDVSDAHVKHKIGYGCDEEAIRLVNLLKFEKKKYKGMRVTFHKIINIHFRIHEASKPVEAAQTFTYHYKEEKKEKKPAPEKSNTYTIKLGN